MRLRERQRDTEDAAELLSAAASGRHPDRPGATVPGDTRSVASGRLVPIHAQLQPLFHRRRPA